MTYDRGKIYKQAIISAQDEDNYFIEDIIAELPVSKPTFYDFFKVNSNELNDIKGYLEANKIATKKVIRGKLRKGEKATELIALYKLICTEEERKSLSQSYQEHSGEVKNTSEVNLTDSQLSEVINSLKPDEG